MQSAFCQCKKGAAKEMTNPKSNQNYDGEEKIKLPSVRDAEFGITHFHMLESELTGKLDEFKTLPNTTCCNMPHEDFHSRISRLA